HFCSQFLSSGKLENTLREFLRRKAVEINSRVPADFPMHWKIRSHNWKFTGHGCDQWMSKRLRIRGGYVDLAGTMNMVEQAIWDFSQFNNVSSDTQFLTPGRATTYLIRARRVILNQAASREYF